MFSMPVGVIGKQWYTKEATLLRQRDPAADPSCCPHLQVVSGGSSSGLPLDPLCEDGSLCCVPLFQIDV